MIYNTKIQIISSNSDWTSFKYIDYDGITDKEKTSKIKNYMKKNQLSVANPDKLY